MLELLRRNTMASTLNDDDERNRRIDEIGEYFLKTGASTRSIADYFTKNKYPISNYTVSKYINLFIQKNDALAKELHNLIYSNKNSYDNPMLIKRIIQESYLYSCGYEEKDIANYFGISEATVSRDLHEQKLTKEQINDCLNDINFDILLDNFQNSMSLKHK